jgi:hypothetical protein
MAFGQTQQEVLPKGAKLKTLTDKFYQYSITGYIYNNQFVEEQQITITLDDSENSTKSTIVNLSGKYFIKNNIPLLECSFENMSLGGTTDRRYFHENQGSSTKGLFKVANNNYGKSLTPAQDSRNGNALNIELVDIYHYSGNLFPGYNRRYMYYDEVLFQKQSDGQYILKIKLRNPNKISLETNVPMRLVQENGFNDFNYFIEKSQQVKIYFENNDVFIGTVRNVGGSYMKGVTPDGEIYKPVKGEYKYSTGEVYTGLYNKDSQWGRPLFSDREDDKITFTDGTIGNGNWLKQYNLNDTEIDEFFKKSKSPTELRDFAKGNQQKLEEERIAKEQTEKQPCVDKYGAYWGTLVYESKYTLGMTKPMVMDILEGKRTTYFLNGMLNPANVTYKDCYIKSNNGKSETLTFSKDKFFAFMAQVVGKTTDQAEQIMLRESINKIKQPLMGLDMLKSNFPTFIFTDGKLTQMYY